MTLRRFTAARFRRKMERGINAPFLLGGQAEEGGGRFPIMVKIPCRLRGPADVV